MDASEQGGGGGTIVARLRLVTAALASGGWTPASAQADRAKLGGRIR